MEVQLQVLIDPKLNGLVKEAISFETGLSRQQAADPTLYAYEHHGEEFSVIDPGALWSFYEDVLLGRPMPQKFATRSLAGFDTLFAIALFLHRDLVTHPAVPGLFASVDLAHRRGVQGLAHVPQDLANFLVGLSLIFSTHTTKREEGDKLRTVIGWIYEYVTEDRLPHTGNLFPEAKVLDTGTNGFVLAEGDPRGFVWVNLYRQGFLRGVLVGPEEATGTRRVSASRKSVYVPFNLVRAAALLNEIEIATGHEPGWEADELWLHSPTLGTHLGVPNMMEVFLRV